MQQPLARVSKGFSATALVLVVLTAAAARAGTEHILWTFTGRGDGAYPASNLVFDSAGNLYGAASAGGSVACASSNAIGCGVVFELTPNSNGGWTQSVLYTFKGGSDGAGPGSLIFDGHGNLYGTTGAGGGTGCYLNVGCGTVFKLTHSAGGWRESVLYSFTGGSDGAYPGGVILDGSGSLYGAAATGGNVGSCGNGSTGCGVVFKLTPSAQGKWNETVLHTFGENTTDGIYPNSGLIIANGNLYGTTQEGGDILFGAGTVFELIPSGSQWTETILFNFGTLGNLPIGGLIVDAHGRFFGASNNGGVNGWGAVFELRQQGGLWKGVLIDNFGGLNFTGLNPVSSLTFDTQGSLYGVTEFGGSNGICVFGCGTVYELTPGANDTWTQTVPYSFSGGADGGEPYAGVILDTAGNIYGTTTFGGTMNCFSDQGAGCGVVFEITP